MTQILLPCSITQHSPPRRTSSSSASASERDRPSCGGQAGMTAEAAERAAQSHQNLHTASGSGPDPGHLFSLEKLNRHNGHSDSIPKKRDDKPADATPSSGFRAHAYELSRDDAGYGQSSKSAPALTSSNHGLQTNPTSGLGASQHVGVSANAQSSKPSGSYSGADCSDEHARMQTLPRQGIKSLASLDSWGMNASQSDSLPTSALVQTSRGSRRHDQDSKTIAGTAQHDTQEGVHATPRHDMLHAWHTTGDEATSLPDPPGDAASGPAAMQASGANSPAAPASQTAASALSQMHQSMRKSNGE